MGALAIPLIGAIGSIVGSVASSVLAPSPPSPAPAPKPPQIPAQETPPPAVKDQAAKQAEARRRRQAQLAPKIVALSDQKNSSLLGQ